MRILLIIWRVLRSILLGITLVVVLGLWALKSEWVQNRVVPIVENILSNELGTEVEVGAVDTPGRAMRVTAWGTRAYVADDAGGLRVINLPAEVPTDFYRVTLVGDVPVGVDGKPSTAIEGEPILAV